MFAVAHPTERIKKMSTAPPKIHASHFYSGMGFERVPQTKKNALGPPRNPLI